ncbi:MAG: transporter substrate-binding domain-containing protein [Desulfoplanes sp.]
MNVLKKMSGLLFVLCFVASQAFAAASALDTIQQNGELRIGFDSGYIPFEMTSKQGKFIGFDIDLGKAMAKAMKVKFVPVNTDFDGIIPALLTNKFDIIISGLTLTQERNMQINFPDPYFYSGQAVLMNSKHAGKITSYKQFNDPKYKVVSKLGTTGEMAVKRLLPKAQYKSFEKEADAALEVMNGNADAYVYDFPVLKQIMQKQGSNNLVMLDKPFTYEPLAFGIKRGDPDFLNWLDNFMLQVRNDGTYDRIYKKWFESNAWYKDVE